MGGFCLLVEFHPGGSAINRATPSSIVPVLYLYFSLIVNSRKNSQYNSEGTGKKLRHGGSRHGKRHGMLRKGILKIAPGTRNFKDSTGARDFHPLLRGGVLLLI